MNILSPNKIYKAYKEDPEGFIEAATEVTKNIWKNKKKKILLGCGVVGALVCYGVGPVFMGIGTAFGGAIYIIWNFYDDNFSKQELKILGKGLSIILIGGTILNYGLGKRSISNFEKNVCISEIVSGKTKTTCPYVLYQTDKITAWKIKYTNSKLKATLVKKQDPYYLISFQDKNTQKFYGDALVKRSGDGFIRCTVGQKKLFRDLKL